MQLSKIKTVLHILFLNNGYWKLLALVIAVLVYFSINSDISHVKTVTAQVEVTNDSSAGGAVIRSFTPRSVLVHIRGSYNDISMISASSLTCTLRAKQKSNSIKEIVEISVHPKNIQGIRNIRIVKIEPSTIEVKFDFPMAITLAVAEPSLKGTALGSVKLSYDVTNAVVRGSQQLLKTLDVDNTQIQCEPINVEGLFETFTTRLRLIPPGDAASIKVEPEDMVVKVVIISEKKTTQIKRVPLVISQPAGSGNHWITDPRFVDIEVSGRAEIVDSVKFGDILTAVDGNIPLVPGLTNEVPVILYIRQGRAFSSVKALPEKATLIPVVEMQSGESQPKLIESQPIEPQSVEPVMIP